MVLTGRRGTPVSFFNPNYFLADCEKQTGVGAALCVFVCHIFVNLTFLDLNEPRMLITIW